MEEEANHFPRKRGAQPGNRNAFKHGFYSRGFRSLELEDLQHITSGGVLDEIDMLRVLSRRLFELVMQGEPTLESLGKYLTDISKTSYHIGYLTRVQASLEDRGSEITGMLSKAFSDLLKEMEA